MIFLFVILLVITSEVSMTLNSVINPQSERELVLQMLQAGYDNSEDVRMRKVSSCNITT